VTASPAGLPPLAVSLGDPAGIGPEIVVKAWLALRERGPAFVVFGDAEVLKSAPGWSCAPRVVKVVDMAQGCGIFPSALPVIHQGLNAPLQPGIASPLHAEAVINGVRSAAEKALSGEASGVVTAPIAKAPLYAAGFPFPGHTEFLSELCAQAPWSGPRGPIMMLTASDLRTALVTIHLPLAEAVRRLTTPAIVHTGLVAAAALTREFGVAHPRLGLAALNPHAGEGGALGREEIDIINPAAATLRAQGVDCSDARPADTLFHADARTRYDAVLCLYHDQALIPVKTIDFWGGVNITLGLPIVRTSPDHGVGYDIAGRGQARAESFIAAVHAAADMARRRAAA